MMQFQAVVGLFLAVFTIQNTFAPKAQSSEINRSLEASSLKNGYAIRLLKPLPRRNSGCETIFRNGEVLESCEPNYGVDPAVDGVIRNYCEWNLHTHYQKNNPSRWLEFYYTPDLIRITNAKIGYGYEDEARSLIQRIRNVESIVYRWIEIDFNDQITGSVLGTLKCYPSQLHELNPSKKKLFGEYVYDYDQTPAENARLIKSGLTIGDVLDQLEGYVQILKTN